MREWVRIRTYSLPPRLRLEIDVTREESGT